MDMNRIGCAFLQRRKAMYVHFLVSLWTSISLLALGVVRVHYLAGKAGGAGGTARPAYSATLAPLSNGAGARAGAGRRRARAAR